VADERKPLAFETLSRTIDGQRQDSYPFTLRRAPVPGGWLVTLRLNEGGGLTFVPDPHHEWDGGSVDVKRGG
jgi:hypothetical protein